MSVNDPDRPRSEPLTREQFIELLVSTGWSRGAAEDEWERFAADGRPVYPEDLTW